MLPRRVHAVFAARVYCTDMTKQRSGTRLSLRRLWVIYKQTAVARGFGSSRRDLKLAHVAFYSGARGVLKVLDFMLEHGETDTALRTIRRFGRQINVIQGQRARRKLQVRRAAMRRLPNTISAMLCATQREAQ